MLFPQMECIFQFRAVGLAFVRVWFCVLAWLVFLSKVFFFCGFVMLFGVYHLSMSEEMVFVVVFFRGVMFFWVGCFFMVFGG